MMETEVKNTRVLKNTTVLMIIIVAGILMWTTPLRMPSPSHPSISRATFRTNKLCVWAWERNEDLSFLDPAKTSVAYYAGHIYLRGEHLMFRPRTQKLRVPAGTSLIPVFRIETLRTSTGNERDVKLPPPDALAQYVAQVISQNANNFAPSPAVQIDFDATADERPLYHAILRELRRQLPSGAKISITCLGSWLLDDKWLNEGEADEVVAMMFSIGADRSQILSRVAKHPLSSGTTAALSLGLSASEPDTNAAVLNNGCPNRFDTTYLFSSHPWSKERFQIISNEVSQR